MKRQYLYIDCLRHLLSLDQEAQWDAILDQGNAYAQNRYPDTLASSMTSTAAYWAWWLNRWNRADMVLKQSLRMTGRVIEYGDRVVTDRQRFYERYHAHEGLDQAPPESVTDAALDRLKKQLNPQSINH